ncbi:putative sugar O-methyltransferase, partial [bacterium]|nr:putative sugar O-methyltransferase [bacterium]
MKLKNFIKKSKKITAVYLTFKYSALLGAKLNFKSIYKFSDDFNRYSTSSTEINQESIKRIACAYIAAKSDQKIASEHHRPNAMWDPIFKKQHQKISDALLTEDYESIVKIYSRFFRESCSFGLHGCYGDMTPFFKEKIALHDKLYYMIDFNHREKLYEDLIDEGSSTTLNSPIIGAPYGLTRNNKFISDGSSYKHYYSTRISSLLNFENEETVLEIGGGHGGMAYYLNRDSKVKYIDLDLPENMALTAFYLMHTLPTKKIMLYGEDSIDNLSKYDIVILPSFAIDQIKSTSVDLVFNSYSFGEMSSNTVEMYLSETDRILKPEGWLYHINLNKKCPNPADNYPIPKSLRKIYKIPIHIFQFIIIF